MEDEIESSSGSIMMPTALALLALVLGGAGLYFGLTANKSIVPLSETLSESSTTAAQVDKMVSKLETQISELSAKNVELGQRISRMSAYINENERNVKKSLAGTESNRGELIKLAEKMTELANRTISSARQEIPVESSTPETAVSEAAPSAAGTYKIQAGDTFGKIAAKVGVSVQELLDANPDADPRRLSIGQLINIPAR